MAATQCLVGVLLLALVISGQELGVGDTKEPVRGRTPLQQMMGRFGAVNLPCELCEEVFGFLLNVTTSKDTLNSIEQLLLKLCEFSPEAYYKECLKVAEMAPDMIKEIADLYLNGTENCAFLCTMSKVGSIPDVMKIMKLMNSVPMKRPDY